MKMEPKTTSNLDETNVIENECNDEVANENVNDINENVNDINENVNDINENVNDINERDSCSSESEDEINDDMTDVEKEVDKCRKLEAEGSEGGGVTPPTPTANEVSCQRLAVLTYEQVSRLNDLMDDKVSIHGRGNFPTLDVKLRDLVTLVKAKLEAEASAGGAGLKVRDIRLNGGAASHVLAADSSYNDLDLIFAVEFSNSRNFDKVKAAVLGCLFDLLPEGVSRRRITTCSMKEAYVSKMVKVNQDGDRWSLISLGDARGSRNVELKFVDSMRRPFEFSVDSFQIVLDSLLLFYECSKVAIGDRFYPTVIGESVYGDFQEALYHLQHKMIATRHPEEIRGGGLLKYCNLLVRGYRPADPDKIKTLERYMCSRFFIDFPDIGRQRSKLENYLWNHFGEETNIKVAYLQILHSVVEESTVCLMGHERRQTLCLIQELALRLYTVPLLEPYPPPALTLYPPYYFTPIIPTPCSCTSYMTCSS